MTVGVRHNRLMEDASRREWMRSQGLLHRPAAPAATATMDAETQRAWDKWLRNNIHNAIHKNNLMWRKTIIYVIGDLRREWAAEIDAITSRLDGAQADAIRKAVRDLRHDVVMKARAAAEEDDDAQA